MQFFFYNVYDVKQINLTSMALKTSFKKLYWDMEWDGHVVKSCKTQRLCTLPFHHTVDSRFIIRPVYASEQQKASCFLLKEQPRQRLLVWSHMPSWPCDDIRYLDSNDLLGLFTYIFVCVSKEDTHRNY